MQIETLIDVDMLIVDQGLHSWFLFQWERGGYTFQMLMTNAVPTAVYIYIYISIERRKHLQ